jgi:hypothetical protein
MMRRLGWTALALALALPVGLYLLEHRVKALEEELTRYNGLLLDEQQATHVLRAEWAHLNEPRRLQELILRHEAVLQLAPMTPEQVARLADLPMRPPPAAEAAGGVPVPSFKPAPPSSFIRVSNQ